MASFSDFIIPIVTSVFSAGIASTVAYFKAKSDLRNALSQEKEKLHYRFVEKLYDKRFEAYKDLLALTQDIGKDAGAIEYHEESKRKLKVWQMESGGYLLLSAESLSAFYRLKDCLGKSPGDGKKYSESQRKNLFNARNTLRGSLRGDFDMFHEGEKRAIYKDV